MSTDSSVDLVSLDELDGRPHAVLFDDEPRAIRLTLDAGEAIAPHRHPGRCIVCYLLDGRLTVTLGTDEYELEAGDVVRFDGAQDISPEAIEDSTALLVMADNGG